jgi:hypothetical protein
MQRLKNEWWEPMRLQRGTMLATRRCRQATVLRLTLALQRRGSNF